MFLLLVTSIIGVTASSCDKIPNAHASATYANPPPGYWLDNNGTICTKCTEIAGATKNSTFTCTHANNSRFSSGHIEDYQSFFLFNGIQIDNMTNRTTVPLYIAAEMGNIEAINILLSTTNTRINHAMDDGATPLFIACQNNRIDVVHMLLGHKDIRINQAKNSGGTPLFISCEKGNTHVVHMLLASKHLHINPTLSDGGTPLFIASQNGHVNVVYALLSHTATQVNRALLTGAAPLFVAAQNGHTKVVNALLSHQDIQVNVAMKDGATPLFIACQNNRREVVQILLTRTKEVNINQASRTGATPLFIACELGHFDIVKLLLTCPDININQALHNGRTPLMAATKLGHVAIVHLLLGMAAIDVTKEEKNGLTVLDVAIGVKQMTIGALIWEKGGRQGLPSLLKKELSKRTYNATYGLATITNETPRIIHQTWKTHALPDNFKKWSQQCKKLHPTWQYFFWTDAMNREFILAHYPWFIRTYDGYDIHIKRVDAVRYFWLYHYGGVYLDLDMVCIKAFDPLLKTGKAIFGYQLEDVHGDGAVANAFMASPPRHPLFRILIDTLHTVQDEIVVKATGPTFLTDSIDRYWNKDDIVVHKMPVIYTHEWNKKDAVLELCVKSNDIEVDCQDHFPLSYSTTAWSGSWTVKGHEELLKQPASKSAADECVKNGTIREIEPRERSVENTCTPVQAN